MLRRSSLHLHRCASYVPLSDELWQIEQAASFLSLLVEAVFPLYRDHLAMAMSVSMQQSNHHSFNFSADTALAHMHAACMRYMHNLSSNNRGMLLTCGPSRSK